jgi:hypothetical protein
MEEEIEVFVCMYVFIYVCIYGLNASKDIAIDDKNN